LDGWERELKVSLTGSMLTSKFVIPYMLGAGGGAIVHFASAAAIRAMEEFTGYGVVNAGVLALSRAIAAQCGFTGPVFADRIAEPTNGSRVIASSVHFAPGARTAWHTHPRGQTIWIAEGVAVVQRGGGPIEIVGPGDRVFFEPGEDHWHGAAPDHFMTHISITETDDDGNAARSALRSRTMSMRPRPTWVPRNKHELCGYTGVRPRFVSSCSRARMTTGRLT
jgi:quercetin dioxygenase-like cupin family protein